MAITPKHVFGFAKEQELQSILEEHVGEALVKTEWRFDAIDWRGAAWDVELKSRLRLDKYGKLQMPTSFKTWVLPATKVDIAAHTDRPTRYYYFWDADQSLWWMDYKEVDWESLVRGVPPWHTEEHYYVPRELWHAVGLKRPQEQRTGRWVAQ